MTGSSTKISTLQLVAEWLSALLDFVKDPLNATFWWQRLDER